MPGIHRRDAPTPVSPRSSAHVGFAETLVTGVTRPLNTEEDLILWDFEYHASQCPDYCRNPYSATEQGRPLCEEGQALAINVAHLMFKIRGEDAVYRKSRTDGQEVRIEVPSKYNNAISLLWAIRDFGHGLLKTRPVVPMKTSFDATYPIGPRVPAQRLPSRQLSARYVDEPVYVTTHSTRTVQPSSPRRSKSYRHSPSKSRGSLADIDEQERIEAARRERSTKYNLAVREPRFSNYYR